MIPDGLRLAASLRRQYAFQAIDGVSLVARTGCGLKIVVNNHERLQETPKLLNRERAADMDLEQVLDGSNERPLVLVGIVALLDAFQKVLSIRAVLGPIQDRLVVLIDAGVISAKGDAEVLERTIKVGLRERVPCARKDLDPFRVIHRKGQLVLDLKVEMGGVSVAANAVDDNVVEQDRRRGRCARFERA